MHEAMAKVRLFKDLDDTYMEEIDDDGYSPSLLCAQVKRDFDDSYLPALLELQKWISNIQDANITMEQSDVLFKPTCNPTTYL
jgi:PleD family two-component response regulator